MAEYRSVLIEWHDEPEVTYNTKVCIDSEWTEGEDDTDVFFYFTNLEEFESAKNKDNDLEFWIVEEL